MFGMLVSDSVQQRFSEIGVVRSSPGGPTYSEILKVETENRVRRAGAFLHGMEYQVMIRAPEVYRMLQVYRDQYRVGPVASSSRRPSLLRPGRRGPGGIQQLGGARQADPGGAGREDTTHDRRFLLVDPPLHM